MNAIFPFSDQLNSTWEAAQAYLRQGLELLGSSIARGYHAQHNANDTHGTVTADSVASTAGYTEHQRLVPAGDWVDMNSTPSDFSAPGGTWTVDVNNLFSFRYTRIGKTIILNIRISNSTITGAPIFLNVKLPLALRPSTFTPTGINNFRAFEGWMWMVDNAAFVSGDVHLEGYALGVVTLQISRVDRVALTASAAFGLNGQLIYEADVY